MSLPQIESVVKSFLLSERNDIIVVRGSWGVGKTFFWRRVFEEARQEKRVSKKSYAYVSLFGMNDLQDLKNAIYASRVVVNSWKIPFVRDTDSIHQVKQILQPIEEIPALQSYTGSIVTTALFLFVRDVLICIDDIERKGADLQMKDLLGLLSMLKDQRNCKIVLILNEDTLEKQDIDEFRKHGEKMVDIDIKFNPNFDEIFKYTFMGIDREQTYIRDRCSKLEIKNIRTLQRIKRAVETLLPLFSEMEPEVIKDVLSSVVLFMWCRYEKERNAPALDYLRHFSLYVAKMKKPDEASDKPEAKEWIEVLERYGYIRTGALENMLIDFAEAGYVDTEAFKEVIAQANSQARTVKDKEVFRDVWGLFHNSFENNEKEFIASLIQSLRRNVTVFSPQELESITNTLEDLGKNDLSEKVVDYYFRRNKDFIERNAMRDFGAFAFVKSKSILRKIQTFREEYKARIGLGALIRSFAESGVLNDDDINYLSSCSVDDFYSFFVSENSETFYYYIRASLEVRRYEGVNPNATVASNKAKEALMRIASESKYNWLRLKYMRDLNLDLSDEYSNFLLLYQLLGSVIRFSPLGHGRAWRGHGRQSGERR